MRKNENERFIIVQFTGYDVDKTNLLEVIDCLKQLGLIVVAEEDGEILINFSVCICVE